MMNISRFHFTLTLLAGLAVLHAPDSAADPPEKNSFKKDELVLCQTKACRVVAVHPAGKDDKNAALRVVELYLGDTRDGRTCEQKCAMESDTECKSECIQEQCEDGHKQYWLLGGSEKKQLLLDLCNNGYGASGVGTDEVTVGNNTMAHSQYGGSNHRWDRVMTVRLSPLTLLNESYDGFFVLDMDRNWFRNYTDWQKLHSTYTRALPPCNENGEPPENRGDNPDIVSTKISLIPRFLKKTDLPQDADSAILGTCALETNAENGFAIKGRPDSNQWMRSLIVGDELWVSVRVDGLRAKGNNWIHDDHLELWLADGDDFEDQWCFPQRISKQGLRQWGIGLIDGKIYPGFGIGPQEKLPITLISRTELRDLVTHVPIITLRIALPKSDKSEYFRKKLTLVLVRGDGRKQISLLATSKLEYGKTATLGHSFDIKMGGIECAVVDGKLNLIRSIVRPPLPLR